jgi:hypothetical protein
MFSKKSITIMIIIIGCLLIFIAGLLLWNNFYASVPRGNVNVQGDQTLEESLKAGQEATKKLIEETKDLAGGTDKNKVVQFVGANKNSGVEVVIVAPQSNPIAVATGKVLTRDGSKETDNSARPGDINAPLESAPVDVNKLPSDTVKLSITPLAITPAEFTVNAGQAVSIAVTAVDSVEVFKFEDSSLLAIAVGLEPKQTRVITFNAPVKLGEYVFYSDFSSHRQNGAVGKMIVK